MTFIFLFCTWIGDENGVGTVFNRAVAWCGDETSNMLSKMTYDGEFIEMSSTDIRSTSDKLYVISKNDALDLEGVDVPTFNATNPDNILLLKSSVEGQPDEIMSKQDWINQIGLSTDSGNDIIVLVSEFSPITTNHPLAGSGDFYIRREDGSYRKYKGSSSSSSYKVGTILYSIQDVLDEFGNKVIENGKVKQSYQVAYDEGIIYSQEDIDVGILIDGTIAKKYKVTYRTERNKLKAEYNAVFVNKTRKLSTDDKTIEDLFNELYKKEG